jgi:hypothetical protein
VADAVLRARILDLGADVATLGAVWRAPVAVALLLALFRARPYVLVLRARHGIPAAVLPFGSLELPPDLDLLRVEVDVLPAEPESFPLSEAECQADDPADAVRA